jgi:hypothetical protein
MFGADPLIEVLLTINTSWTGMLREGLKPLSAMLIFIIIEIHNSNFSVIND